MQLKGWFIIVALAAAVAPAARAETAIGGAYLWNHETGGPFEGRGSGYKIFMGGYQGTAGAEVAFVNFGKLGGDGPHAQAWTSGVNLGFPIGKLQTSAERTRPRRKAATGCSTAAAFDSGTRRASACARSTSAIAFTTTTSSRSPAASITASSRR
jgi:hypothetical protein